MLHTIVTTEIDVRTLRTIFGMSALEFSNELGYSDQTIRALENGKIDMSLSMELAIIGWVHRKYDADCFNVRKITDIKQCFTKRIITEREYIRKSHRVRFHIRGGEHCKYSKFIVPIEYREEYNLDVMVYATSAPKDDAWYLNQIDKYGSIKGVKY